MSFDYIYLSGIALSLMFVVMVLVNTLFNLLAHTKNQTIIRRRRQEMLKELPEIVRKSFDEKNAKKYSFKPSKIFKNLMDDLDEKIKQTGLKLSPAIFLITTFTLAFGGFLLGLLFFEDLLMAFAIVIVMVFLPNLLLNWAIEKEEQRMMEQLSIAMQLFSVEYEMSKDVAEALLKSSEGVKNPLKKMLEKSANDLIASKHPKEVFKKLGSEFNNEVGKVWARILLMSTEDKTIVKLMPRLITLVRGQRILQLKNNLGLSTERRLGILLNLLVVPGFILVQIFFPDSKEFFNTPFGRIVVLLMFLSLTVGISLDRLLRRVEL